MSRWLHVVRTGAMALALAVAFVNCANDGPNGGGNPVEDCDNGIDDDHDGFEDCDDSDCDNSPACTDEDCDNNIDDDDDGLEDCEDPDCDDSPACGPEDCDNNIDDDDDGLEDCEDPDCRNSPACVDTTTSSTTSSTIPPGPIAINFILQQTVEPLGALQFTASYTSAPGRFVGDGFDVECTNNLDGSVFTAHATDATSKLVLGFISLDGFDDPADLATCLFEPDTPVPVPSNFTIVVNDAADPDGNEVKGVKIQVTVTGAD